MPLFFKTYSAREKETEGMSAKEFVKYFQKINKNAKYFDNFQDLQAFLCKLDRKSVLLFLGAGDLPAILNKNNFIS
jgi:UDP-N-acetylmuramate-alanine ligase